MPIYEFICDECGHGFESLQKLSDPLPEQCPSCGANKVRKHISAAGFRLKGGGWYETDFKSGQKKNVSGADGGKPSGGSDASSDSGGAAAKGADGAKSGESGTKSKSGDSKSAGGSTTSD